MDDDITRLALLILLATQGALTWRAMRRAPDRPSPADDVGLEMSTLAAVPALAGLLLAGFYRWVLSAEEVLGVGLLASALMAVLMPAAVLLALFAVARNPRAKTGWSELWARLVAVPVSLLAWPAFEFVLPQA